jgi:hypothetical protein
MRNTDRAKTNKGELRYSRRVNSACFLKDTLRGTHIYSQVRLSSPTFVSSNIPASTAYGVYISQLMRYHRHCAQCSYFLDRAQLLTQRLHKHDYVAHRLKSWLQILRSSLQSGWPLRNCHISNDNDFFILSVNMFFPLSFPRLIADLTVYMSY